MAIDFAHALKKIPAELNASLAPVLSGHEFAGQFSPQQVEHLVRETGIKEASLPLALLPLAAAHAITPISDFQVGAIAKGVSGTLYFGANMEFAGTQMGQTVHAEQAAIAHAWMSGETMLTDIIIDTPPCGHCRQFMNELTGAENLLIQLPGKPAKRLHEYLPEHFGPGDLGIHSGLMSEKDHHKQIETTDKVIQRAVQALNKSHAPYSENFSGIAIEMKNQQIYIGAYAENAAFNPSLPPLQVAFIQARMAGHDFRDIQRVVLAETTTTKVSHLADTQIVLHKLNEQLECEFIQVA